MKLEIIKQAITSKAARQLLLARKHSPTIMFVGGVIGVVATAVLASRATLHVDDILDEHDDMIQKIEDTHETRIDYTDVMAQRDKAVVYFRTGARMARVYAPAVLLGGVSIALLTGAHVVLNRRYAGAAAAYAAVDKAFKAYRARVKEELGEDKDREFRYGNNPFQPLDELGVTHERRNAEGTLQYARFFDESNKNWKSTSHLNSFFLKCTQSWANDLLRMNGHVFLNEVYDMLGFDRTREGAIVGWVLERGDGKGDGYIDFGIFDHDQFSGKRFVAGEEPSVLVDFNVDGIIWNII